MSAPPFAPPLPSGWTEHIGPGGQPYYYHAVTQQSTYIRPLPALPTAVPQPVAQPVKKKEKPLVKTPIPGTEWLRVKTTEGNVFYSHKAKKDSVWVVPEEIKEAVEALEQEEREKAEQARQASLVPPPTEADRLAREQQEEIERVKADVQELVKRKAESAPADEKVAKKKVKLDEPKQEEDSDEDSEDEEWQREAAEQLAAEAELEHAKREEAAKREEEEAKKAQSAPAFAVPSRVDLSIEEAKALFKTLLREKDINPLLPWDTCLPFFVNDPRYVLLPSVAARRDAFDEYCRDRARERRQTTVKHDVAATSPKAEFERLLVEEVKSTRTSWQDFRRQWKKERCFYGWGRDDRERERRFRDYLKELGEKKRAAAQKAEVDFFAMLKENGQNTEDGEWKDVKKQFVSDPRYDAVGSSSLRQELFQTYLQGKSNLASHKEDTSTPDPHKAANELDEPLDDAEREKQKKEKKERAVREREDKMRAERERVDADINKSRVGINREEGEREFRTLLVDAIRDPKVTWDEALPQLKTDPRLRNSPLPFNQQIRLFHEHISHLRSKSLAGLHALFDQHAPTLATRFTALPVGDISTSPYVTRLGFNVRTLEDEYDRWQRERAQAARKAFDEMLTENSFIEFWGRLKQIGGEGVDGGVKADDEDEDGGEGGGGKVDMKALAKSVDVREMVKVLKNDKRYILFDHLPEQREKWIRGYLAQLSAPKLSVHVPDGVQK